MAFRPRVGTRLVPILVPEASVAQASEIRKGAASHVPRRRTAAGSERSQLSRTRSPRRSIERAARPLAQNGSPLAALSTTKKWSAKKPPH